MECNLSSPLFYILILLISLIGLLISASYIIIRRVRSKQILSKFQGKKILNVCSNVNFFGRQSKGPWQVRGNGVLVLTGENLYFEMWIPKKQINIPVSSIKGIEVVRSFLGKTRFVPLLKVVFKNESGNDDAAAWYVTKLDSWKEDLTKLIQGK